ncbi:hypothetical protein QVD17_27507 [Tagetes erecta]|uniref:Uncharacterized protein n=1 Tax=Tagetes erecta TaxID=13708 RepID=A0AAD8K982_TARER|nr:hypothetical protein QVD17_27507 [Tagetes erecta]
MIVVQCISHFRICTIRESVNIKWGCKQANKQRPHFIFCVFCLSVCHDQPCWHILTPGFDHIRNTLQIICVLQLLLADWL